jgi:hypothetical protein
MSVHLLTRLYQKTSSCIASGLRSNNSPYLNRLWRLEESKNYFRCSALNKAPIPRHRGTLPAFCSVLTDDEDTNALRGERHAHSAYGQ